MKQNYKKYIRSGVLTLIISSSSVFIAQHVQKSIEQPGQLTDIATFESLSDRFASSIYQLIAGFNFKELQKIYQERFQVHLRGQKAEVTSWPTLQNGEIATSSLEGQFIALRLAKVQDALRNFTGYRLSKQQLPRIGMAFSGGGYRAMIVTAGFLKALEDIKLLDGILYFSTLSGSTWCVGPWTFLQSPEKKLTANTFRALLAEKAVDGEFNLISPKAARSFDVQQFFNYALWPKLIFNQPINSVDLYGAVLSHTVLSSFKNNRFDMHLGSQWEHIKTAEVPWPIYTAISMQQEGKGYQYTWYEFNPEYIINKKLRLAIPSFSFGRKFENGLAINKAPEQSFGYLMGIFGSAYAVNVKDILRIYFGVTQEELLEPVRLEKTIARWFKKSPKWAKSALNDFAKISKDIKNKRPADAWRFFKRKLSKGANDAIDQLKGPVLATVLRSIPDVSIAGTKIKLSTARFAPAQIHNPFYKYSKTPALVQKQHLTLIDAGIDYNIPLLPLFDPERRLDLVLVGDASGDVPEGFLSSKVGPIQLNLALKDIKATYGIDYVKDAQLSNNVMCVYRPKQSSYPKASAQFRSVHPPTVVYFNFINDEKLLKQGRSVKELKEIIAANELLTFDARACLKDFCGTFNFDYSPLEVKQLSGIAEFNIKAHQSIIIEILDEIIERTREDKMEFGG